MTGHLTSRVRDNCTAACQQATPATTRNPAAEWLEAQFTWRWLTWAFLDEETVPGPASLRPMIELIDQDTDCAEDDYGPMTVGRSDYDDPGRWWL